MKKNPPMEVVWRKVAIYCCEAKVAFELGLEGLLGFEQFGKRGKTWKTV